MQISLRAARRVAITLAASAATVASMTAASAAPGHPARPDATPRCSLSQLTVWIGLPGSGAAGSTAYPLEFSNTSGRTCHLLGYPGVSAFGAGRAPAGQRGRPGHVAAAAVRGAAPRRDRACAADDH